MRLRAGTHSFRGLVGAKNAENFIASNAKKLEKGNCGKIRTRGRERIREGAVGNFGHEKGEEEKERKKYPNFVV